MIATLSDFQDATAFELYTLETVRPVIEPHDGGSIDLRDPTKVVVGATGFASVSGAAVNRLKDSLSPLLFGAAWKVIDLMLEFTLNKASLTPNGRNWSIAEKESHARSGAGDRSVLGCTQIVWNALLNSYAGTVEHRHCLVHRSAKVDLSTGTLEGKDQKGRALQPLTREQQVSLAKVAGIAARAVAQRGLRSRSEDHLKYYLDQLRAHSAAPAFGVPGASAPVEVFLALTKDNGSYALDMTNVIDRVSQRVPSAPHFDLRVDVPDGSGRQLFAHAEDAPTGKTVLNLEALPTWIQFR